jgi:transposase
MKKKYGHYSPELKERAVRMVKEMHTSEGVSEWAAIQAVSSKLGCKDDTLRRWVRGEQMGRPGPVPDQAPVSANATDEQKRISELERENRQLRQANEILRKASAYFAQAELDRRFQ